MISATVRTVSPPDNRVFIILSTSIVLCLFLAIIRERIVNLGWDFIISDSPFTLITRMLAKSFYDFVFVLIVTVMYIGLLYVTRARPALQNTVFGCYFAAVFLILIAALTNIPVVAVFGQPFNYPLLYYSDFLLNAQAYDAVASFFSWDLVAVASLVVLGAVVASLLLTVALRFAVQRLASPRILLLGGVGAWVCYLPVGAWYVVKYDHMYEKLQNPVVFFLASTFVGDVPQLFAMDTPFGPDDVRVVAERRAAIPAASAAEGAAAIKNVLIYVLESVPAEYIESYGGIFPVTPTLSHYRSQSLNFTNIYANSTSSPKSIVPLLCSIYPLISYKLLPQEYPDAAIPCLSSELSRRGYRTAYFQSADLRFQGFGAFLEHRGFDVLQDYTTRRCNRPLIVDDTTKEPLLAMSSDDGCTADALVEWIERDPERPFFAVLWTNMTHYPYFAPKPEIDFVLADFQTTLDPIADQSMRPTFNRYLNGLHHIDRALGDVLRALEREGLAESTLVVVLGDHGQAFGHHGQFAHGHRLYEENIHIPLIFINPSLFDGGEDPTLGSIIDVAPTIMDLLDFPLPGDWQGRSLFDEDRSHRVYFFTPWSDLLFGYREDDRKFIFNATKNEYEVYDLALDPKETRNLADQSPEVPEVVRQRLAAWVQYQSRLMQRILSPSGDARN